MARKLGCSGQFIVVSKRGVLPDQNSAPGDIQAHCPAGYVPIAGGYTYQSGGGTNPQPAALLTNGPKKDYWEIYGWNTGSEPETIEATATCLVSKG